ncbi:hypothetical protein ESY86_17410 [Subsaximicrobium wynnwilliamsii]|uniref:Lipoprotein n=1 Tax=Subsaximicrobium wynnwilliamsii TaxID=291179 RepID=A0A5C6ZE09_9FLAO|nr:hypothetical protein [Subsaximicrobium wynnwilliamsii]TXD81293.1 hypothetical protein ESY87_18555 [Subsaximicrobium wynnwilliamsii]TXD87338.1 hypothetical protein ESY86_17410 [Subsaximicrobium wynnwilliamsii]TXE00943.1 hypothetical protein ESY88_17915 [Subsaximicrobium wynnwilliamsii]
MKNASLLFVLMLVVLLFACQSNENTQVDVKKDLITKFISSSKVNSTTHLGKIVILETEYCNSIDCQNYFKAYENEIIFYSKTELFMRAINNYVVIEKLDKDNGHLVLTKRSENGVETIEIKI